MTQIAYTAILSYQPYANRSEHLNYGVVVFLPDGGIQVYIAGDLRKIRAFNPQANIAFLQDKARSLPELVGDANIDTALSILNATGELRGVEKAHLGCFVYSNEAEFQQWLRILLNDTCSVGDRKSLRREQKSRLYTDVSKDFRNIGILDIHKTGNPDHQVVTHYAPDSNVDVVVEFALQNGALHVAQTIDLRNPDSAQRDRAFGKIYKIGYIKEHLNSSALRSYVIVAGATSQNAQKVIRTIQDDADEIIEWEDRSGMNSFYESWAEYAGKPLPKIPSFN